MSDAPRRCRRHDWYYFDLDHNPIPGVCMLCGKLKNPTLSRTNRNNRKRGNRTSHDLAVYLGGRNVEALKLPWDVEAKGCRVQSKRQEATPRWVPLLDYIDFATDRLRAVYTAAPRQRLTSGIVVAFFEEWVAWHGWDVPAETIVWSLGGRALIRMTLPTFRDLHIGEKP